MPADGFAVDQNPRSRKAIAVGGETAGDHRVRRQRVGKPTDEIGAVDRQSFGKYEHQLRSRCGERASEPAAGGRGVGSRFDPRRSDCEYGLLKLRDCDDQRPIGHLVVMDFAGARTADDRAIGKGRGELVQRLRRIRVVSCAKSDNQRPGGIARRWERDRPAPAGAMRKRLDMHMDDPIPRCKAITGPRAPATE